MAIQAGRFLTQAKLPLVNIATFWAELRNYAEATKLVNRLRQGPEHAVGQFLQFIPRPLFSQRKFFCMLCGEMRDLQVLWPATEGAVLCSCGWMLQVRIDWRPVSSRELWPAVPCAIEGRRVSVCHMV